LIRLVLVCTKVEIVFLFLLELHFTHFNGHSQHRLFIHFSHAELAVNCRKVVFSSKVFLTDWSWLVYDNFADVLLTIHFGNIFQPCFKLYICIIRQSLVKILAQFFAFWLACEN
jgi:hypothetical protein